MGRKHLASIVMLLVAALTGGTTEASETIAVEVDLSPAYTHVLGVQASAEAKANAETALVTTLSKAVKYFDFVSSSTAAPHKLTFLIDHPSGMSGDSSVADVRDYYVFVSINGVAAEPIAWLFSSANSNLNGVVLPKDIGTQLSNTLLEHTGRVTNELLAAVSFTDEATLKSQGSPGWYVRHSRTQLCIQPDMSEIKVRATVPQETFLQVFEAEVKDDAGDNETMFSLAKSEDALKPLLQKPDEVHVKEVFVSKYFPDTRCGATRAAVTESSPSQASSAGGAP